VRVLVTGATGYLGSAVVPAFAAAGHDPVAFVRDPDAAPSRATDVRVGDLLDAASIGSALRGVDAVCHLGGLTRARDSWQDPLRYFEVNTGGTVALMQAMAAAGVLHLVFASTGSVYGTPQRQPMAEDLPLEPPHPYAGSKAAAESAIGWQARSGGLGASVLRLFNVAGGRDPDPTRIIPRVLAVAAGDSPHLKVNGDGSAVRDFLHIADAADAFVAAIDRRPPPGTVRPYNIGSGRGSTMLDVVAATERVTGRPVPLVHMPAADEPQTLACDPTRAMAELGWKPRRSDLDAIVADAWTTRTG
jgi:nucleoside-diphosphate-sugar epimerase